MSTDPFVTIVPRKMTDLELARAIRLDVAAEIDAINLYQAHIDATDDPRAKAILAHIRDEEIEHMAEFLQLVAMLDPVTAQEMRDAPTSVAEVLAVSGSNSPMPPGGLTVGSLKNQEAGGDYG